MNRLFSFLLAFFFFPFLLNALSAQNARWLNFRVGNDVVAMADDGTAYWFATGAGLIRRDQATGEEMVFTKLNSALPAPDARVLAVDHRDRLWAGFYGSGVAVYDGSRWQRYNTGNSGLPNDFIQDLLVDRDGNVWAATWGGGVARFDGNDWSVFNNANAGIPNDNVNRLALDSNGAVWCGTYNGPPTGGGLAAYDGIRWTPYPASQAVPLATTVYSLAFDQKGEIWVGLDGGTLYHRIGSTWQKIMVNENDPGTFLVFNPVLCVLPQSDGTMRASTYAGLFQVVDTTATRYTTATIDWPWVSTPFFYHDRQGMLWIGGPGAAMLADSGWQVNRFSTGAILSNTIHALGHDGSGGVWASWNGNGLPAPQSLGRYAGAAWTFVDDSAARLRSGMFFTDMELEKNGSLWLTGGGDSTIVEWDGMTWRTHIMDTTGAGRLFRDITRVAIDSAGNKWFAAWGGLAKYNGGKWTFFSSENSGIHYGQTGDVAVAPDGTVWFATNFKGLGSFDGTTWKAYTGENELPTNKVHRVVVDHRGNVWAATSDNTGLLRRDPLFGWRIYTARTGDLPSDIINCMTEDHAGNIWVGTYKGLARFDGVDWETFTEENSGLANNNITALDVDNDGNLWIGTMYGGISVYLKGGAAGMTGREQHRVERRISVAPNPASSRLLVNLPEGGFQMLRIFTARGTLALDASDQIRRNGGRSSQVEIDLISLPAGEYFLEYSDNTRTQTEPLVIIR